MGDPNDAKAQQDFQFENKVALKRSKSKKKEVIFYTSELESSNNSIIVGHETSHNGGNSSRIGGGGIGLSNNPDFDVDIDRTPAVPSFDDKASHREENSN
jgi:hypothetical protein